MNARRDKPNIANVWFTAVTKLFEWATREVLEGETVPIVEANPCEGVRWLPIPKRADPDEEAGHPEFSDEDLTTFARAYPEGTRERLVFSILLYTGLRVGDAARFGRQHVQRDGTIRIRTEKTGAEVAIEIVPPLRRALDAGPHGRSEVLNFLTTARGHAWSKTYLGHWFSDRCRAIGLDRSAHGLRKTSARLYAEAGMKEQALMALFGWRDPAMAHYYVKRADRKRMAIAAQRSMDWAEIENRILPYLGSGKETDV